MRPPYAQDWNLSIQRVIGHDYLLDVRYVGNKGTRLPRLVEANPPVFGPGSTSQNIDQRRIHAGCNATTGVCDFASVGLISNEANSTYHALQAAFSRRFSTGLGFLVSYWFSKSLDDISSFNVSGSAPTLTAGENDLAQNPNDLAAEHGPSIFDARQRLSLSGIYLLPRWKQAPKAASALVNGWQLNVIGAFSSGTPFTVYDSANVSEQGSAPEISGFYSSRPNLVSNPNNGPHTPSQWVSASAFQRLDPTTQAGQFGNEGRNVVRGPGITRCRSVAGEELRAQPRLAAAIPRRVLSTSSITRTSACRWRYRTRQLRPDLAGGPPRLLQFAVKLISERIDAGSGEGESSRRHDDKPTTMQQPMFLPGRGAQSAAGALRGHDPHDAGQRRGVSADLAHVRLSAEGDRAPGALHAGDPARAGAAQSRACAN